MNMQAIIERLKQAANQVTSQILKDLVQEHMSIKTEMIRKYNAYQAKGVPILTRSVPDSTKANNKLVNDFRGEVVDQIVGYLFGNPVTYFVKPENYENGKDSQEFKNDSLALNYFRVDNRLDDIDAETGKMMSICGRAVRLCYINTEGKERVMNIDPWECIFIYDRSLDQVQYALRYYTVKVVEGTKSADRIRVEWYDNQRVYFYIQTGNGDYVPDLTEENLDDAFGMRNSKLHLFDYVPLLDYPNNKECQGDFEKVESLIDGYDKTLSDAQNEIEDLRLAYLLFKGIVPTKESLAQAKQSGAFGCDKDDTIEYLTKQINDTFVENHKKTLRENIYRFAKSVDVHADTFTGSGASGEARKWLLLALENKGSTKERKFKSATFQMFKVLSTAWNKKNIKLTPQKIDVKLDRNLPVELLSESQIQMNLKGMISDRTRLGLLSVIADVDAEIQRMQEEQEERIDLIGMDNEGAPPLEPEDNKNNEPKE